LDNVPKAVFDALTHAGVWQDDSQIDDMRVTRCNVFKGGAVRVSVQEVA
jgi:crossover junction endodeoxyribonuclease RusA